jgi:shikimate dehydrogenase
MRFAGIIGHPVAHSLSPAFQAAAFRAAGLDATYERWETPAEGLPARVDSLRDPACLGANVTIPHKEAVLPHLDSLDASAARVGAVNTIANREGRLSGHNTDGAGFIAALRKEAGFEPAGRRFLLVGAGGAARGIAFALAAAGASAIGIVNRSQERAERLAREVASAGPCRDVRALATGEPLDRYECAVNCTSLGMHGGPDASAIAVVVGQLALHCLVVDIVYAPEETPLLAAARARGNPALGGLPMLIHQGALAFEIWTGLPAPIREMEVAARDELRARSAVA